MITHFNDHSINILNGEAMYQYLLSHKIDTQNCVPFNEAMCMGDHTIDVFSNEYIQLRCKSLNTSTEEYIKVLAPLRKQLIPSDQDLNLWFDDDMFCQINLLVLLSYLEQIDYKGKVVFNQIDHTYRYLNSTSIHLGRYKRLFKEVLIDHQQPESIELPLMKNGVGLYLEYMKPENEITRFIMLYINLDEEVLLKKLFQQFERYGLGDIQYLQLIKRTKALFE